MPWIDVAAAVAVCAMLVVGLATQRRSARAVIVMGALAAALLVAAFLLEGGRGQLLALAAVAALGVGTVAWVRSARHSGWAAMSAVILSIASLVVAGASWALPPVFVAAGTGIYDVGVDTAVWVDDSRDARGGGGGETGQQRSLPVTIWYPAEETEGSSAYLPMAGSSDQLISALAAQYGVPALVFDSLARAQSPASWQSAPADGSFAAVVASPGSGSTRWLFTSWAVELASHGIVVVAVDHPFDAAAVELADGTLAFSELQTTGDDARDQALADGWAAIRATDLLAVLDRIEAADSALPALTSVDPQSIIAAGHSLGGAAAIEAARRDARVAGVVDIDGMPRSPSGTALAQPLLALVAGEADANPAYDAALDELLAAQSGAGVRLTLDGVAHLGFIDAGLMLAPVPGLTGMRGSEGAHLAAQATLLLVEAVKSGDRIDTDSLAQFGQLSQ